MKASHRIALAVLAPACVHEFIWQAFRPDVQGDVRAVTQWPLVALLCALVALLARDRIVTAACAAAALMSLTTAACSLSWLIDPWLTTAGEDQCSRKWGVPMLLVSGIAALLVLSMWRPSHGSESG